MIGKYFPKIIRHHANLFEDFADEIFRGSFENEVKLAKKCIRNGSFVKKVDSLWPCLGFLRRTQKDMGQDPCGWLVFASRLGKDTASLDL